MVPADLDVKTSAEEELRSSRRRSAVGALGRDDLEHVSTSAAPPALGSSCRRGNRPARRGTGRTSPPMWSMASSAACWSAQATPRAAFRFQGRRRAAQLLLLSRAAVCGVRSRRNRRAAEVAEKGIWRRWCCRWDEMGKDANLRGGFAIGAGSPRRAQIFVPRV